MIPLKLIFDPPRKTFYIENIHYVSVKRLKNFNVSFTDGRKQHSFLYTATGSMRYSFFDSLTEDIIADAGELIFIPAGTRHTSTYMNDENTVHIVQFDLASGELPTYLMIPCQMKSDKLEKLFYAICTDIQSGIGDDHMYLLYRLYELFWHISQKTEKIPAKFRKLQIALKELRLFYADNHKIQYYADLCGMSEPGFRRLFKEYTSLSPIDYRNQIRLQEANKLLNSGEFCVEEVSLQVGFSNLSFFCRSYKKQFGHSPGKDT